MEDLFATPRPKYGLPEAIDDEDESAGIVVGNLRRRRGSNPVRSGLRGEVRR